MKKRTSHPHHLFIDMSAGVAGDMFLAALLDLTREPNEQKALVAELEMELTAFITPKPPAPAPPPIKLTLAQQRKHGIRALGVTVNAPADDWQNPSFTPQTTPPHQHAHAHDHAHKHTHEPTHQHTHEPTHRTFKTIVQLLARSKLSKDVQNRVHAVFSLLAEAEATVHHTTPANVHFHEVGSLDAICEVVGVCLLLEAFSVQSLSASPIVLGSGSVTCAHGKMPVPVPAVTEMLSRKQAPYKKLTELTGELTTPTGAALVLALASTAAAPSDPSLPPQTLQSSGWGAGTKEIKYFPNILRVLLSQASPQQALSVYASDTIIEIRTSLDDITGEHLAFVCAELFTAGAYDVYFQQIVMKKSRAGILLHVLAAPDKLATLGKIILEQTPAIGYRYQYFKRHKLKRTHTHVNVDGIDIAIKVVDLASGGKRIKAEDAALREASKKLPHYAYNELLFLVEQAYRQQTQTKP